jgi:hypothetical protein
MIDTLIPNLQLKKQDRESLGYQSKVTGLEGHRMRQEPRQCDSKTHFVTTNWTTLAQSATLPAEIPYFTLWPNAHVL